MTNRAYTGIVTNVKLAILDAQNATQCIKGESPDNLYKELSKATAYVLAGLSRIRCAESIFLCHDMDPLDSLALRNIITKYDVFAEEMLESHSSEHMPQAEIYFDSLLESTSGTIFEGVEL